ncbi:unnamed protein product [Lampetra fluviatilis]
MLANSVGFALSRYNRGSTAVSLERAGEERRGAPGGTARSLTQRLYDVSLQMPGSFVRKVPRGLHLHGYVHPEALVEWIQDICTVASNAVPRDGIDRATSELQVQRADRDTTAASLETNENARTPTRRGSGHLATDWQDSCPLTGKVHRGSANV